MASFGEELRRERELRDISLKEIAEATKISIKFLEALEQNHFDLLPGGIFNRGFIRAYARFIGVDGEEMVNAYLHEVSHRQAHQGHVGRAENPAAPPPSEALPGQTSDPAVRLEARRRAREASAESKIEARPDIRLERRLVPRGRVPGTVEGRTSVALWALVVLAFLVGAGVLTMSLMDQAGTGPSVKSDPQPAGTATAQPPPTPPLVAGVAEGLQAAAVEPGGVAPSQQAETPPVNGSAAAPDPNALPPVPTQPIIPERQLRIVATETTRVRVECADKMFLDQELWPGQTKTLTCTEPVLLSADNAGAVQYSIDDSPARLLGGVGEKVEGLVVAPTAPPPSQRRPAPAAPQAGQGSPNAGD